MRQVKAIEQAADQGTPAADQQQLVSEQHLGIDGLACFAALQVVLVEPAVGGHSLPVEFNIISSFSPVQQAKRSQLQSALQDICSHQSGALQAFARSQALAQQHLEACVSRLMLELETAGNIRLEEGRPSDGWYQSCADLVTTRFDSNSEQMKHWNITGIKVRL